MLLNQLITENRKLRYQLKAMERRLAIMRYPQVYAVNMSIWLVIGFLLGLVIFWR